MSGFKEAETMSFHPRPYPHRASFDTGCFVYFQHRFANAAGRMFGEIFFDRINVLLQFTFVGVIALVDQCLQATILINFYPKADLVAVGVNGQGNHFIGKTGYGLYINGVQSFLHHRAGVMVSFVI